METAAVRTNSTPLVQCIYRIYACLIERELEYIEVNSDTLRSNGLRDSNQSELEVPANDDLGRRLAVLFRDPNNGRILQCFTLAQGAPGLGSHAKAPN